MPNSKRTKIGTGQIILLVVLTALLILAGYWSVTVWQSSEGVEMSGHGWIALGLGTFFSLLIGCGLMALMFYSSRRIRSGGLGASTSPPRSMRSSHHGRRPMFSCGPRIVAALANSARSPNAASAASSPPRFKAA